MMVALLGPDQNSGVHQQALMSLRKLAEADVAALQPHLPTFMPCLCALMGTTSGALTPTMPLTHVQQQYTCTATGHGRPGLGKGMGLSFDMEVCAP